MNEPQSAENILDFIRTIKSNSGDKSVNAQFDAAIDFILSTVSENGKRNSTSSFVIFFTKNQDNQPIQTVDVSADIVIVLDLANLGNDFKLVIDYFTNFAEKFTIGLFKAQIAGVYYSNKQEGEFYLSQCSNASCLSDQFKSWHNSNANDPSLLVDILDHINKNQLISKQGWRQSQTFVLVFSAETRATWDENRMIIAARELHDKNAYLLYIDMSNEKVKREQLTSFDDYLPIGSPKSLINGSEADQKIVQQVTSSYQKYRFPLPKNLTEVVADFVFVVDVSTGKILTQVKDLVGDLVDKMTINETGVQVAFIAYSNKGQLNGSTFDLNKYPDFESLSKAIQEIPDFPIESETNLGSALEYLNQEVLKESNGLRETLTFVTFFSANPNFTSPLQDYQEAYSALQKNTLLNLYAFNLAESDQADRLENALKLVVPLSTQVVQTTSVLPEASAINGNDGYFKYIIKNIHELHQPSGHHNYNRCLYYHSRTDYNSGSNNTWKEYDSSSRNNNESRTKH
ncbi:unnamed protein product, partial [Mesorhabditis belari]|uniref:VWFA domain-containing protein n=1 Tax=Mesorhabditis belari TaxID=2138241 RepID=A0AAF3FJV3_9BILA